MTVEYIHLFHPRYNMVMNDVRTNKRVPLLILLAIFVAGGAYVVFSLAAVIAPARTIFFEKEFYQADIVFSEDLECLDSVSEAKMLINLEFDKSSETESRDEIKPVIFRKGKVYQLSCRFLPLTRTCVSRNISGSGVMTANGPRSVFLKVPVRAKSTTTSIWTVLMLQPLVLIRSNRMKKCFPN